MEVDSPESPPSSPSTTPTVSPECPEIPEELQIPEKIEINPNVDMKKSESSVSNLEKQPEKVPLKVLLTKKYKVSQQLCDNFNLLLNLGDLNNIYRNRPCFINQTKTNLVKPATDVFREVSSSRQSVYYYVGLLIHEYTHVTFNKRENPQTSISMGSLRESINKLIATFQNFIKTTGVRGVTEILQWTCNLATELSVNNSGRPCMGQVKSPEAILSSFSSCDVVEKTIGLMDTAINILLEKSPEHCMKVLFEASRHGTHFIWIWLHIATTFPDTIITHLLKNGVDQFKNYHEEFEAKKSSSKVLATVLSAFHNEYQMKFSAISDVFNFLMRKRNPELQHLVERMIDKSLNSNYDAANKTYSDLGFSFFVKLVTCSMETLRIVVTNNTHLITPWNSIRAIRQLQSVDQSLILAKGTYRDFLTQVAEIVDPLTHGIVFEMLIALVYDKNVFDGEMTDDKDANLKISEDCKPILEVMMNRIVRIAHATGPANCPSQHPSISVFAYGEKLQFIIQSMYTHVDQSNAIIRHLHAIAIANGESKAAEIVLRFMLTIEPNSPQFMYVLMAFITTTAKFYPHMMDFMYKEFFALKTLIEMELPEDVVKAQLNLNLLNNLRTLFIWEAQTDDGGHIAFLRIYPGENIGELLNTLLSDSIKIAHEALENEEAEQALTIFRMFTKLLESICAVNSSTSKTARKFLISLSTWYKLMAQFAILLKISLMIVGRDVATGISVFEEMRTSILIFLYNGHIDVQMQPFVPIFTQLFISICLNDAETLFGEKIVENSNMLLNESGMKKSFDLLQLEDGPNILEGIRKIGVRDSALSMMHSGQLKRRKIHDFMRKNVPEEEEVKLENGKQRVFVVLDALRAMCMTGGQEIQLKNSKQVAVVLLETICKDTLTMDMKFDEWELEAEYIHRHVEIDRKVNQSLFCDGVLRILSETRSFAYCLPIMKAQLAVVINDAEKNSDRGRLSEITRSKLHRWMVLANRSNLLPQRFVYLCDLEYYTNSHETFLLLLEVWRFLMGRNLTMAQIDNYHTELLRGDVDEGLPNEKEGNDRANYDIIRLILQNHITETYHLFPKLFPAEFDNLKLKTIEQK